MLPYWTLDKKIAKALERYQRDVAEANCVVCSYAWYFVEFFIFGIRQRVV